MMDRFERIRKKAYEIWQSEGCPPGEDLRHWLIAKSELDENVTVAPPLAGLSVFGERDRGSAGDGKVAPSERAGPGEQVAITTGAAPPRKKVKRTEGQ
ncbi:hypothetical protein BSY16_4192 (plasmid) [Sinorhizobium sp. RAC02]|nr:hypothetical protein BSY16_4192 [Sinorhizobium sp. RAC02]